MENFNSSSTNKTGNTEEASTGSIILVLSFAVLISCLCKIIFVKFLQHKINLSFYVIVLFLGFLIGIIATHITGGFGKDDFLRGELQLSKISPHLIYYIFLPLIVFDSSFNAQFHVVRQQIMTTILIAGPGVLISTGIITLFVVYLFPSDYQWTWVMGLLFGCILSTTDPRTIVSMLQDWGASPSLSSLIDSESLLNDGLVFTFFSVLTRIVDGNSHTVRQVTIDIVRYSIGGPLFGLCCGFICVFVLSRINNELKIEITITFGITYLVFFIADAELGVSAVLALISMGLYMAKHKYCISSNVQLSMAGAWQIIIFVVNILVFTLSGLIIAHSFVGIETNLTSRDIGISVVLYLLMHVSRVLTVGVLHPVITWSGVSLNRKECVVFAWSGLRGHSALILVLLVYLDSKFDRATRERFLFHISMIVLFTLIINGTTSQFLVKMLGLHKGTPESQSVLFQALKHMRNQTSKQIKKMKEDVNFASVNWKILHDYLPEKLLEELDEEHDTDIHRRLSAVSRQTTFDATLLSMSTSSDQFLTEQQLPDQISTTCTIFQLDMETSANDRNILEPFFKPRTNSVLTSEGHQTNMRNEIIKRFLTAMSADYKNQWHQGMIRRRTLKILLETVEEAKTKVSLERHWQLLVRRFCMPLWLKCLVKFDQIRWLKRITERLLFNHFILTIELTLAFHSAKSCMENMLITFPEFVNIDSRIIDHVLHEVKMLQLRASIVLHDLQHSYTNCWAIEMTKRCAQMLLKYETVAIVQLYETGMLNENEYTRILKLIQKKIFRLEYGHIMGIRKTHLDVEQDSSFSHLPLFAKLPEHEKDQFKELLESRRRCFQPGEVLLKQGLATSEAYLIIRGIVECSEDLLTCYTAGHVIGIDLLFDQNPRLSNRTYRAESSIVEVYTIDRSLLQVFLSNTKMTRLIYDEIALHVLINMYQQPVHLLNYAQVKVLLDEFAEFYPNDVDDDMITIQLRRNERLFLLVGTVQREDDDSFFDGPQLLTVNQSTQFHCSLNQLCVAYTWTLDDEQECLQIARSFTTTFRMSNAFELKLNGTMSYPSYSGYDSELIIQHRSLTQVARSGDPKNSIEAIPMEILNLHGEKI